MGRAVDLADRAARWGDVPVGAVVLDDEGSIIGEGANRRVRDADPTAHAEILALRSAGDALGTWNLAGCTLVVTLEPCTMCAGAAVLARVSTVVFGVWDEKTGAAGSLRDVLRDGRLNHQVEVHAGIRAGEVSTQLADFFDAKRSQK